MRGKGAFSVNGLVHMTGHGDFQLSRIDYQANPRATGNGEAGTEMRDSSESFHFVEADPMGRQSLIGLRELDPLANEQSLITEEELREADEAAASRRTDEKKTDLVAQGVPEYKAAWEAILPSDDEGEEDDDGNVGMNVEAAVDNGESHAQLALKFRMERDEMEFPDEVDTPLDRFAKDRFQRYRGLKNFAESPWDPKENLPLEYGQIFEFEHLDVTQKRILKAQHLQVSQLSDNAIVAGMRVALYLDSVSRSQAEAMSSSYMRTPSSSPSSKSPACLVVSSLFEHEQCVSVAHYKIRRSNSYTEPLKNKEELLWSCGFRRFMGRPIFSSYSPSCNKHKVERFLHAQRPSIASLYTHVTFGPFNVLAFKRLCGESSPLRLVASGSLHEAANPNRINVKRIVLTGYPIRVQKRKAVVRYMFFTPEDVRWFKPVTLTTKYGLIGQIDEPVGTHGYFKCSFNGFVKPHDTVCLVLYKRQFPVWDEDKFRDSKSS